MVALRQLISILCHLLFSVLPHQQTTYCILCLVGTETTWDKIRIMNQPTQREDIYISSPRKTPLLLPSFNNILLRKYLCLDSLFYAKRSILYSNSGPPSMIPFLFELVYRVKSNRSSTRMVGWEDIHIGFRLHWDPFPVLSSTAHLFLYLFKYPFPQVWIWKFFFLIWYSLLSNESIFYNLNAPFSFTTLILLSKQNIYV